MRKVCLIILITLVVSGVKAQKFTGLGDTIVVYIDNQVEIKLSVADYSTFNNNSEAYIILMSFQSLLPGISARLDSNAPEKVSYDGEDKLFVEPGDLKYQFLLDDNGIKDTGFRDVAILSNENTYVMITTTDLSKVSDLQLQKCFSDVITKLPQHRNNSYTAVYACSDGKVTLLEDELGLDASLDMLGLTAGTGASLIKNRWAADLSAELFFSFNKKGVLRYNPYISTNLIFDFDSENKMNVNTFLNVGHRWNLEKKPGSPDWLGVEVGYLVNRQGDLFGKNTYKLGLNWSLFKGRSVYVSPQLYFSDNFNTVYPAVRIGIGL